MTVFHYVPPCAGQQGPGENRKRMWADVGETNAALVHNEKEILFFLCNKAPWERKHSNKLTQSSYFHPLLRGLPRLVERELSCAVVQVIC